VQRSFIAIWTCVIVAYAMLGSGAGSVCVSYGEDPCLTVASDACCPTPGDSSCPPSPDGDRCCIDVFLPTMAEPVSLRLGTSRDVDVGFAEQVNSAFLAIPPPRQDLTTLSLHEQRRDSGPPRDIDAIVRTARLLL
jgi:hypothetical protein